MKFDWPKALKVFALVLTAAAAVSGLFWGLVSVFGGPGIPVGIVIILALAFAAMAGWGVFE